MSQKLSDYFTIQATGSWTAGTADSPAMAGGDAEGGVYYTAGAGATLTLTPKESLDMDFRLRYQISSGGSLRVGVTEVPLGAEPDFETFSDELVNLTNQESWTLLRDDTTYPPYTFCQLHLYDEDVLRLEFTPGNGEAGDYVKLSEFWCGGNLVTEADALGGGGALGSIHVSGANKKIVRGFLRVNGVNRKLKTVYIGMNGAARKIVG